VDPQILALIDLQSLDTRIAALETEAARLPKQIDAIHTALADAKRTVEALRAKADTAKKDLRTKEKDLEVITAKRTKAEARLWEVKNNTEYSAVLAEIEAIKQEKAKAEEEILALMELQERLAVDIRDTETQFKRREAESRQAEAVVRKKLAVVEEELAGVRGKRESHARKLPKVLVGDYEKILRARGGVAVAAVTTSAICGGCRVAIRPQAIQELKAASHPMVCESCGRYLHWQEPA
jgi:predicted  nucleic acid-binding Zn-ribbon protein